MFNSISWQEFISAIAIVGGAYYAITSLLLYKHLLSNIFNHFASKRMVSTNEPYQMVLNESNDLMGEVKRDEENVSHENFIEAENIEVRLPEAEDEAISLAEPPSAELVMIESAIDLFKGLKTILSNLSDDSKEEIVLLFRHLLSQYPHLIQSPLRDTITIFIFQCLGVKTNVHFEIGEVKQWWNEVEITTNDNHQ
jgi:hypothetical protein